MNEKKKHQRTKGGLSQTTKDMKKKTVNEEK